MEPGEGEGVGGRQASMHANHIWLLGIAGHDACIGDVGGSGRKQGSDSQTAFPAAIGGAGLQSNHNSEPGAESAGWKRMCSSPINAWGVWLC